MWIAVQIRVIDGVVGGGIALREGLRRSACSITSVEWSAFARGAAASLHQICCTSGLLSRRTDCELRDARNSPSVGTARQIVGLVVPAQAGPYLNRSAAYSKRVIRSLCFLTPFFSALLVSLPGLELLTDRLLHHLDWIFAAQRGARVSAR